MNVRVTDQEFPRFSGLRDLVPGHAYLDDKGVSVLFLDRGRYFRTDGHGGWEAPCRNAFLYMKARDLDAKLADGRLDKSLSVYDPHGPGRPDFFKTVFFSRKPRVLLEDLGRMYPPELFLELDVTDLSGYYEPIPSGPYHWHVRTG